LKTFQKYRRTEHYRQNAISIADIANDVIKGISIPVLGSVPAGIPLEAITDVLDYEEISPALAAHGEYFALKIKGNSMSPRICDGDVVIVKKESAIDSGYVAIIMVNGNEATCKEVQFSKAGITLVGWNVTEFQPIFYTKEDVETLPVRIVGRVVEVRIKSLKRGKF
jgi:repressor LexA